MPCEIGTPQGGPVSPVLANIMLNEATMSSNAEGTVSFGTPTT